jgi:polyisoprenyl-phosphate glycosyltransferase
MINSAASATDLSIVIPCYNEEKNIRKLYDELKLVLTGLKYSFEIIFADDGSRDETFAQIRSLHEQDSHVNGISLSRNFGHQIALYAGMSNATGNIVITMDGDLQHPPAIIAELLQKYEEGYDIVNTRRIDPKDIGAFKKLSSSFFYKLMNTMSDVRIEPASADFRLMNRKAVDAFLQIPERDRFTRGLVSWMGFRQAVIDYHAAPRFAGKSKYTLRKMMRFASAGITSFSSKPLRISFYFGLIIFFLGLGYAIYAIIAHFLGKTVSGWTSIMVSVLIIGGVQLLSIGIIGEYIAKIFHESKARPMFFIKDKTR